MQASVKEKLEETQVRRRHSWWCTKQETLADEVVFFSWRQTTFCVLGFCVFCVLCFVHSRGVCVCVCVPFSVLPLDGLC